VGEPASGGRGRGKLDAGIMVSARTGGGRDEHRETEVGPFKTTYAPPRRSAPIQRRHFLLVEAHGHARRAARCWHQFDSLPGLRLSCCMTISWRDLFNTREFAGKDCLSKIAFLSKTYYEVNAPGEVEAWSATRKPSALTRVTAARRLFTLSLR
jgi:hypothetical protein